MSKLRVHSFSISLDGYGAGPDQSLKEPLGVGGEELHGWVVATRKFHEIFGKEGGTTGPDNDFTVRGFDNIGAWIMGRNMFGPIRGPGPTTRGKAGGATTRPIIATRSCSRITRAHPSGWRAAPRFTS